MRALIITLLVAFSVACSPTYPQLVRLGPAGQTLLIRDATVFPATGPTALAHHDVIVRAGRILSVAPTGAPVPGGARVIDGKGKTLLPGFVDAHVHLAGTPAIPGQDLDPAPEYWLRAWLYAGVTTIYDLGGIASDSRKLRDRVRAGEIPGPDIFFTHPPITAPGGHPVAAASALLPWPLSWLVTKLIPQVTTPASAAAIVDEQVEDEVDYIKAIADDIPPGVPQLDRERLKALAVRTHHHKRKFIVHIGDEDDAKNAVAAGADVLAHGIWKGPLSAAVTNAIAAAGVPVIFTLWGFEATADIVDGTWKPAPMVADIMSRSVYAPLNDPKRRAGLIANETLGPFFKEVAKWRKERLANVKKLHDGGVTVLVGTDSPIPGAYPGSSFHRELELLHKAGIPAAELLQAATAKAARAIFQDPDFGTIEKGKRADLVLVRGDPLTAITATRNIDVVISRGRIVQRVPIALAVDR